MSIDEKFDTLFGYNTNRCCNLASHCESGDGFIHCRLHPEAVINNLCGRNELLLVIRFVNS